MRSENQDAFFIAEDGAFMVVADGLGGMPAGEIASALAVETTAGCLTASLPVSLAGSEGQQLHDALAAAQQRVLAETEAEPLYTGMATTLIAANVTADAVFMAHAGDARGYVWHDGEPKWVTNDHSLVGRLVQAGVLTREEARSHPRRNIVTQAIGLPEGIEPELGAFPLADGDTVLLCSDGLFDALSDDELATVVSRPGTASERALELIERANDAGGRDNVTLVLYDHRL